MSMKAMGVAMENKKNKRVILYCQTCNTVKNYFGHKSIEQTDDGVHIVYESYEVLFRDVKFVEGDDYYLLILRECIYDQS